MLALIPLLADIDTDTDRTINLGTLLLVLLIVLIVVLIVYFWPRRP